MLTKNILKIILKQGGLNFSKITEKINVCPFKLLHVNLCSQFMTSYIMVFVGIRNWNPQDFNLIPRLT